MSGVSVEPVLHPLRDLAERVPAVLFVAERGRLLYVSPASRTMLGRPPGDYLSPARYPGEVTELLRGR